MKTNHEITAPSANEQIEHDGMLMPYWVFQSMMHNEIAMYEYKPSRVLKAKRWFKNNNNKIAYVLIMAAGCMLCTSILFDSILAHFLGVSLSVLAWTFSMFNFNDN